jgi:hypothetical protein
MSSKRKSKHRSQARQTGGRFGFKTYGLIMGVIALAVITVAAFAILDQGGSDSSSTSANPADISLDKSTGPEDASVVVVEYGDFQ